MMGAGGVAGESVDVAVAREAAAARVASRLAAQRQRARRLAEEERLALEATFAKESARLHGLFGLVAERAPPGSPGGAQ